MGAEAKFELTHDIEIEAPAALVWEWIIDPEKQLQWMKGVVSNEVTGGDGRSVGSTFLMKIKEGGRVSDYVGEIKTWDEPNHLEIDLEGGCGKTPMKMNVHYRLEPAGSATKVIYEATTKAGGCLMTALGWLFKIIARKMLKGMFKRLKAGAEAEARAAA